MTHLPHHLPSPAHDLPELHERLRRTEEALADQRIERRLDRDRMALLRVQVEDLNDEVTRLRRGARPHPPGHSNQHRRPARRGRR